VTRNVQIIHPDGLAQLFQGSADSAVVLGGFGSVGQHIEATAKVLDR
jgi:hypothetical protein